MSPSSTNVSGVPHEGTWQKRRAFSGSVQINLPEPGPFQLQECRRVFRKIPVFQCPCCLLPLPRREPSSLDLLPPFSLSRAPSPQLHCPFSDTCGAAPIGERRNEAGVGRTIPSSEDILLEEAAQRTPCRLRGPLVETSHGIGRVLYPMENYLLTSHLSSSSAAEAAPNTDADADSTEEDLGPGDHDSDDG
jgi:hypothetical protein